MKRTIEFCGRASEPNDASGSGAHLACAGPLRVLVLLAAFALIAAAPAAAQGKTGDPAARKDSGIGLMEQGRYEEAIAELTAYLRASPRDAHALAARGECYRQLNQYESAVADFSRALELSPDYGWVLGRRGEVYRAMGKYDEAIRDLDRAIGIDPQDSFSYASRADAYRLKNDYRRAVADFTKAIEISPEYPWAIARRGEAYRMLGDLDRAMADLDAAIRMAPGDSFAYASRGQTLKEKGDFQRALADFDKALELDPDYPWASARREELLEAMREAPEAPAASTRPAPSGSLPLVAVLDFRIDGVPASDGQLIVDVLTSALVQTRSCRVLERSQREALLKEIEFSRSDLADEKGQLEIGRMLSADRIVVGSLGKVGQRFVINAKMLDVRTGEALGSAYRVHRSLEELVDGCGELASTLMQ